MRTDTAHLIRGTPASIALCEKMAERCKGVCLFGFSRGKDAVGAWLWLRKFFHTIIPFHIASVPHLSFVDRSLAYYEKVFQTKIMRFISGDTRWLMWNLVFQPGGDHDKLRAANPMYTWRSKGQYNNNDIATVARELAEKERGSPLPDGGWIAFGISAYDSLFRRLRMTEKGTRKLKEDAGYRESTKTFFPCFDWHTHDIIRAIELTGIRLPDDYQMANRTVANGIDVKHLNRMKKMFPKDFERVRTMFPFIEAHIARNEFRKIHAKQAQARELS